MQVAEPFHALRLDNEQIRLGVLPKLGGKIVSVQSPASGTEFFVAARDK